MMVTTFFSYTKYKEKKRTLCVSKPNFYTQKIKNHLPAVNLKFFITTPNLTSKIEKHKNVVDNFFFVYKASLSFGRTSAGIVCFFLGCLVNVIFNEKYLSSITIRKRNNGIWKSFVKIRYWSKSLNFWS